MLYHSDFDPRPAPACALPPPAVLQTVLKALLVILHHIVNEKQSPSDGDAPFVSCELTAFPHSQEVGSQ